MSKRFWSVAAAIGVEDGFAVALDGRRLRLPSGAVLRLGTAPLAEAVAAEWQVAGAKGGDFSAADMPLTGLAGAAQERVLPDPRAMVQALVTYAAADQLCYRVDQPTELARAQAQAWQPWLDWAALRYGATLCVTTGITFAPQPADSLLALRQALAAQTAEVLAALGLAIPALGSCVLGLALAAGAIEAALAMRVASVDEDYQQQRWGLDEQAVQRRARIAAEVEVAQRFMELSRA